MKGVRVELLREEWEGECWVWVCPTPMGRFWDDNVVLLHRS